MDHIFVRAGRPLRIHFDTIHLGAAVGQFNHTVERLGGVVVSQPSDSDVLVVDPSDPWVFQDFIKTRRPELRPSVVLGFWIPLCLTSRRLVWINDPYWSKVSVPLERPTYPEMLPGVFAYTSFVAGVKFSKILLATDSTASATLPRQRDHDDTFMSDAGNSVSEVSREIAPGSDSDEDLMLARARKKSKLRALRLKSISSGRASPAISSGADVTMPNADEAEVSGMIPETGAPLPPQDDVDMVPAPPLPEPIQKASATEKEAPPPSQRSSPADAAEQPPASPQSPKVATVPKPPQQTATSVQEPAVSVPTPSLLASDAPSAPSAGPATQTRSPSPQYLVIASSTPPEIDTPGSSQIAQKGARESAQPSVAPGIVSNGHTLAEAGRSAPRQSKIPATDAPASSTSSTPPVQRKDTAATQGAPPAEANKPAISETSNATNTPPGSSKAPPASNESATSSRPAVPPPTPSSESAAPKPSAAAKKGVSPNPSVAASATQSPAPISTPAPKTPALAKPSPLSVSSTGLKFRLDPGSERKLTVVNESSSSNGSSGSASTPASASKPRPRPKMRPAPLPEDDESERPTPPTPAPAPTATSAPASTPVTTSRPSAPLPKSKLHIRLGPSTVKTIDPKVSSTASEGSAPPSQSTAASSSQQAPASSPTTTASATPTITAATTPAATPASQKTTTSAPPVPGSTIRLPKKLIIRNPTVSTIPPRPAPIPPKPAEEEDEEDDEPVFIPPGGIPPPPVPPTPTPDQLASKRPPWTREEDQYIIDYMNWAFAQDRLASTSEIMKEIAANCPYRSVGNWQNRFTAKEDSIYMQAVPVLFERLTNRTSRVGQSKPEDRSKLKILSGTRTRNRRAADEAGSSSDEERTHKKRARVERASGQGTRR